jgi:hypothetical protein
MNLKKIPKFLLLLALTLPLVNPRVAYGNSDDTEIITGSIRARDGVFYLNKAYGPGMFHEFEVVGDQKLLEEAAEVTSQIYTRDAEVGLVGRMDALAIEVSRPKEGKIEVISYNRLD